MDVRKKDLMELQSYIAKVDSEVTMILQQMQWDKNNLIQEPPMVNCKYNSTHRIPASNQDAHEEKCFLQSNGYSVTQDFLSDSSELHCGTLIKLSKNNIKEIIEAAAIEDTNFRRGNENVEPLSIERLQSTYTSDERRALYDAVVKAAPSCHDLSDLALTSDNDKEQTNSKPKSRIEILAELRDMKRRRTKYRVAAKTRNYSDLLRDVIKTQMEVYTGVQNQEYLKNLEKKLADPHPTSSRNYRSNESNYDRTSFNRNKQYDSKEKFSSTEYVNNKLNTAEDIQNKKLRYKSEVSSDNYSKHDKYYKNHRMDTKDDRHEDYKRRTVPKHGYKDSDDYLKTGKKDKSYHRSDSEYSNSKTKQQYEASNKSNVKNYYDNRTASNSDARYWECKYNNGDRYKHKRTNDGHEEKHRHRKSSRETETKYDQYEKKRNYEHGK